jgi:uncharacterized membrane protein
MKTINLCIVYALIVAGVLLLIVDCATIKAAWLTLAASLVCFGAAIVLAHWFHRNNLLPE